MKVKTTIALLLIIPLLLQGCIVAGIAAGTAVGIAASAIVYDGRSFNTIKNDQLAEFEIQHKLNNNKITSTNTHISVAVFHRIALLIGQAPTQQARLLAGKIAAKNKHISRVVNEITLGPPTTILTRTNDTWITTKVRTMMLAEDGLKSGQIKIVTGDGVVYLMGIVSHRQAQIATNVARRVSGVQKVVKVFLYKKSPSNNKP